MLFILILKRNEWKDCDCNKGVGVRRGKSLHGTKAESKGGAQQMLAVFDSGPGPAPSLQRSHVVV
eukprot:11689613-Ditylum_brightwellii.AAC.1